MWKKQCSVYQDHMKYIRNYIAKPFKVKILRYAKRVREIHDIAKYFPPPSMKGDSTDVSNWTVHNQEFMFSKIWLGIKDRLPSSMKDELENHQ